MFSIAGYQALLRNLEHVEVLLGKKKNYDDLKDRKEGPILPNTIIAVRNSILNHWPISISYLGDKQNAPGRRWVDPYVWGLSKFTGNNLLRAWQYKGASTTITEGWKTFRLDRIRSTAPLTSKPFNKPQALYNPDDEDMSTIIIAAEFSDETQS